MTKISKIQSIAQLAEILRRERSSGGARRTVHCHGVFDLLHIGHIRYLQKARELGDQLVVTLTPDHFVNKGPHRPAFHAKLRADALAALDCVDYVAINEWQTASEAIRLLKPNIFAKGAEFRDRKTPELEDEEQAAREVETEVAFIEELTSSSSHLLNRYLSPFEDDTETYLRSLRDRVSLEEVLHWLDQARNISVLVVGETIIDEYYACSAIGRSGKAPILSTRYDSHDRFVGGAAAIANHLASFCGQVGLLSMLGSEESEEDWVRERLAAGVNARFLYKSGSPTIVKRRYQESYFGTPLFAINFLSDVPLSPEEDEQLGEMLGTWIGGYDVVLVADYGHQMISPGAVERMSTDASFLAVNTQSNAANLGFHTVSKYPRADYVSLAERELQLECRSLIKDLRVQLADVSERLAARTMAVTLGKQGCLCFRQDVGYHQASSLTTNVVDRVGAGDAFFAISSLCARLEAPLEVLALLGNVAGAEAVAFIGNSRCIESDSLRRHVTSLFK